MTLMPLESRYIPDLIKGDLDSLRLDVRSYYETLVRNSGCPSHRSYLMSEEKGVLVVEEKDQNLTDLMKCVLALEDKEKSEGCAV